MNVHDSRQMAQILSDAGYVETDEADTADIIIVNTCSVREKAAQKAYSQLGRLKRLRKKRPGLIIAVAGCLAQEHGAGFFRKAPYLDLVVGTHNIHRLPAMLEEISSTRSPGVDTSFHDSIRSLGIRTLPPEGEVSAYVTIMQGCNNFCSYCIVPYVRGREESRTSGDILDEIRFLADNGVREITLLGQNVNSYGSTLSGNTDFPALLREIHKIQGIERIRFTTSHPKDLSERLADCFTDLDTLCEHIHLPVQSGSDDVLKKMKRGYTAGEYLKKIEMLKRANPDISITSDIIVGFPGETDSDFQKTIDLMKEVRFDNTFSFKYSDRDGTASKEYDKKVEETIKSKRLTELQALQESHSIEKNRSLEGSAEDVLIEGISKNSSADVTGRTRSNKIVNLAGNADLSGETVHVKIVQAYMHSLRGELIEG